MCPLGATHGISIIVDIHATNGSQNGFDHSAPVVVNGTGLQQWDSNTTQPTPSYPAQAVALTSTLAARYGASPALLGFALLNEPTVCSPASPFQTQVPTVSQSTAPYAQPMLSSYCVRDAALRCCKSHIEVLQHLTV